MTNVFLDTATNDSMSFQYPLGPNPDTYLPFPHDIVTLQAGALDARGLEAFRIVTGIGSNVVHDHTLEGGPERSVLMVVDGRDGPTQVIAYGTAPELEFEQLVGSLSSLTVRDTDGSQTYEIGLVGVASLVMADPQPFVRAIVEDGELTFDESEGRQIIQGGVTTFDVTPGPIPSGLGPAAIGAEPGTLGGSRLQAVLLGDSRLNLGKVVYGEFGITGVRDAGPQPEPPATPDDITISPFFAGPQPEPPRPPVEISGYGPEDRVFVEAPSEIDGTQQPTGFTLDFESLNLWGIELLMRPVSPLAQAKFVVAADSAGEGPVLGLIGNNDAGDTATVSLPAAELAEVNPGQLIELLIHGVPTLNTFGTNADEFVTMTPQEDGGLQSRVRQMDDDGNQKIELFVTTDPTAQSLTIAGSGGDDAMDVLYPEPDFRSVTVDTQDVESLSLQPSPAAGLPGLVAQTITPTSGELSTGNLLLTDDGALTTSTVDANTFDVLVARDSTSSSFTRSLSLNYAYLGSEGKYVFKDVTFKEDVEINVQHKDGTANTTTIQQKDVIYEKQATTKIAGADDGDDQVLLSKAGVETKQGSTTEIDLQGGDDVVIITETNSGQSAGTEDVLSVKGSGGGGTTAEAKVVLYHKQQGATTEQQLDDLKIEKPEYAAKIDVLKTKADPEVLIESGTAKVAAGEINVDYQGEATQADIFLKNVDAQPVLAKVQNADGSTTIAKVGNVIVSTPELDGTGIDPTQPFATFTVTNTLGDGDGSLRAAIEAANAWTGEGLAVITFDIPETDLGFVDVDVLLPGGDDDPDVFVIAPETALPELTRGRTIINGQSQHTTTGDTNPFGPEIILAGNVAGSAVDGLHLASSENVIHGLNIQQFEGHGILVTGNDNTMTGNYIGTDGDGNSDEIEGNTIAHNTAAGMAVLGAESLGNTIRGNSVHSNGGLGIDLGGDGVTANDNGGEAAEPPILPDTDPGPNDLQNAPEIRSAVSGQKARVAGQLRSTPDSTFIIDFYANSEADPSGYGEGARWLDSIEVTTDESGAAGFSTELDANVSEGNLSATATNAAGSTSEFSNARIVRGHGREGGGRPNSQSSIAERDMLTMQGFVDAQLLTVNQPNTLVSNPAMGTTNVDNDDANAALNDRRASDDRKTVLIIDAIQSPLLGREINHSVKDHVTAASTALTDEDVSIHSGIDNAFIDSDGLLDAIVVSKPSVGSDNEFLFSVVFAHNRVLKWVLEGSCCQPQSSQPQTVLDGRRLILDSTEAGPARSVGRRDRTQGERLMVWSFFGKGFAKK